MLMGWKKNYCSICKKTNADHVPQTCPRGTVIYHGTKKMFANMIQKNGFQAGQGRIGTGVYFTFNFEEAKEIAYYKYKNQQPVVIQCIAEVKYQGFSRKDSEAEHMKKLDEWSMFCKKQAKQALHPQWANNSEFQEICVKDPKAIVIIRAYDV